MRWTVAAVALLVASTILAGCLDSDAEAPDPQTVLQDYVMEGEWSTPLSPALYDILPAVRAMVPARDDVAMSIGIFRPDIEGCDWQADDLPETCRLPILVDAGPYYTDRIDIDKKRPIWGDWLVPRGYIYVQMALRGTGESEGCMAYKAPTDADDISDVVDWLVDQPWSNGSVAVAGRSYDGTSAWAAAASGNPHVKTIIPISGAVDAPRLYFKNGTSETRALIPHAPIYWLPYAMGIDYFAPLSGQAPDPTYRADGWVGNICPEVAEPHVEGPMTAFTGDASSEYWQSRDLTDPILDNYNGSVWVIHGLRDWNVNPSQAVPFVSELQEAGIPTLGWLGQWAHMYPDNTVEHPENPRWDWAEQVVTWLDYYLQGIGDEPWLGVEVESDDQRWRQDDAFPASDAVRVVLDARGQSVPVSLRSTATTHEVPETGYMTGMPHAIVDVTVTSARGGQLSAELFAEDGRRLGWGVLDLRNHAGGNTDPAVLTPGQTISARIEFEPMDARIQAGETLTLQIHRNGVEDINPDTEPAPTPFGPVQLEYPFVQRDTFLDIPMPEDDPRRG